MHIWQAVRITRLPGYTPDAATLGVLVWARTPAGVWWPGEALDPFHMPPTRTIPPLASAGAVSLSLISSLMRLMSPLPDPQKLQKAGSNLKWSQQLTNKIVILVACTCVR